MTKTRTLSTVLPDSLRRTEHLFGASPKDQVPNKQNFVPRYKVGEFGNASPTWNNYEDWVKSGCPKGKYHIRNRIAQGNTWYNVDWQDLDLIWGSARNRVGEHNLYISAMAPHHCNVIQGEVWQDTTHLHLTYSVLPDLPMREALKSGLKFIEGLPAVMLLKRSLCANSWDWLNQLLDSYPGHVVEFSTFSCEWGTVPGYNTVWWEVRKY